jgi:hypothetical protein
VRVVGWPEILHTKVEEWHARPFAWGSSDCYQFVADMVLALTGVDHRERFGIYTTKEEAFKIIAAAGGGAAVLTACLGEPKPVTAAMPGDLLAFRSVPDLSPAVSLGLYCCGVLPSGLAFTRSDKAVLAWTV